MHRLHASPFRYFSGLACSGRKKYYDNYTLFTRGKIKGFRRPPMTYCSSVHFGRSSHSDTPNKSGRAIATAACMLCFVMDCRVGDVSGPSKAPIRRSPSARYTQIGQTCVLWKTLVRSMLMKRVGQRSHRIGTAHEFSRYRCPGQLLSRTLWTT